MKLRFAALLCFFPALAGEAEACPGEVRVSFPNFPIAPLVLGTDHIANPPGQLISWTRNAYKQTGCKGVLTLLRRPPNRQLAEFANGEIDFLPGFSVGPDLPAQMVFPMREGTINTNLRLVTDLTSLYVRAADNQILWDGKALTGARKRIGSSTGGSNLFDLIKQNGWELDVAPTPATDLQKLLVGRVDVILESDSVLEPLIGNKKIRKLTPPLHITHRYAPVRKAFQQQYPEFTERFWLELCNQSRMVHPNLPACK